MFHTPAKIIFAFIATLPLATTLQAGSIGPNCSSCYGSIYTLSYLGLQASTATTETHRISLTVDAAGFEERPANSNQYISAVALKVSNSVLSGSLLSAPGGIGAWELRLGGLNANNCSGAGSGFVCAQDGYPNAAQTNVANPVYSWVFQITTPKGDLFTSTNEASIKANYDPMGGTVTSENITLGGQVPEPATVSLVIGGMGVWLWSRRNGKPAAS